MRVKEASSINGKQIKTVMLLGYFPGVITLERYSEQKITPMLKTVLIQSFAIRRLISMAF